MMRLTLTKAREQLGDAVNRVIYQGEHVVLQRHGEDAAVLVPLDDFALIQALRDRADLADLQERLRNSNRDYSLQEARGILTEDATVKGETAQRS